jgi:putative hydrolase of the HAD superfamily
VSYRAVLFDLWQTLVPYDRAGRIDAYRRLARHIGAPEDRFVELWRAASTRRDTGPLLESARAVCSELGLEEADVDGLADLRRKQTRLALAPLAGVLDVLGELRRRGHRLGLVSVCSEDVADVWEETPLAPRFDALAFSCLLGVSKPDPRLYLHVCERLGVAPGECLYVGDGANDELGGAERVGMTAVQLLVPGGADGWNGRRIDSLDELLALV